jgi:D-cysteine desulfhydrase
VRDVTADALGIVNDRPTPRLFERFPELGRRVPFLPLAHVPTPVEPATRLEPWLGRGGVFVKRDDLVSPLYGGNKIRRFEYLFADAKRRCATRLVTTGGLASTQVTATIVLGRAAGFEVTAALFDQPITAYLKDALRANVGAGGTLVHGGGYLGAAIATARARLADERAYLVLPGASTPLPNLGYVDAMLELGAQVDAGELPRPDLVVLPTGSGGTLAGLVVGARLLGWDTTFVGVRVVDRVACNGLAIRALVAATARLVARHAPSASFRGPARFRLDHRFFGAGYGYPTPEAVDGAAAHEALVGLPGVRGEITYSGKGLAALRTIARENPRSAILYWNTLSSVRPPLAPESDVPASLQRFLVSPSVA